MTTTTLRWRGGSRGAASTSRRSSPRSPLSHVAMPTWGVGTGGTRFARFPGPGEPRDIFDKLEDCATIHQLTRVTPTLLAAFSLGQGQRLPRARRTRRRARHRLRRRQLQHLPGPAGAEALLQVRLADPRLEGGARPGGGAQCRMHRDRREARLEGADRLDRRRLELRRPVEPLARLRLVPGVAFGNLRRVCPPTGGCSSSTSSSEPAFYSTVISDWGTSLMAAQALGPKARCLVDLGHHAPNVNIEQIVARLIARRPPRRLPFQRFEIRRRRSRRGLDRPVPPVPGVQRARRRGGAQGAGLRSRLYARPVAQRHRSDREPDAGVDRGAAGLRRRRSSSTAPRCRRRRRRATRCSRIELLKEGFLTDVSPILAEARRRQGGAIDPIATYRASGYRAKKAEERPAVAGSSSGIV